MLNALDITLCCHLYEKRDILHLLFSESSSNFFLATALGLGSVKVQRSVSIYYRLLLFPIDYNRLSERKSISTERYAVFCY